MSRLLPEFLERWLARMAWSPEAGQWNLPERESTPPNPAANQIIRPQRVQPPFAFYLRFFSLQRKLIEKNCSESQNNCVNGELIRLMILSHAYR